MRIVSLCLLPPGQPENPEVHLHQSRQILQDCFIAIQSPLAEITINSVQVGASVLPVWVYFQ